MLFHIVDSRVEDKGFEEIVKAIRNAYWPEERYTSLSAMLPSWAVPPSEDGMIREIANKLDEMVKEVCGDQNSLYIQLPESVTPMQ